MKKSLSVKNLSASYKNREILSGVDLELYGGELLCLCGPNGCGKSTLVSILDNLGREGLKIQADELPLIKYENGENFKIFEEKRAEIAKKIAILLQNEQFSWNFCVKDVVLSGRYSYTKYGNYSKKDEEKVLKILEKLELKDLENRNINTLSGGELQKVRLARALAQEPEFLLLDEPTNNLDMIFEPKLLSLLKKLAVEEGIGILLVIHDVNTAARFADRIMLLPKMEKPVCGLAGDILTEENLFKTYKTKLQTYKHPIYNCLQVYEK